MAITRRRRFVEGRAKVDVGHSDDISHISNRGHSDTNDTRLTAVIRHNQPIESSWVHCEKLVMVLNRPKDPSCLALFRILYGLLMVIDCMHERGMAYAIDRWGDDLECRFPLLDFLKPLPVAWMCILYTVMLFGAAGIALGFFYRLSSLLFVVPYWYVFLLDKTAWNNHSYLFGLLGTIFLFTDANHCWSVDGLISERIRNAHVPYWNYIIFRAQFFIVYFIAGLKKLDADWVKGYSMQHLSMEWVFDPFRAFLTAEQIDLYVVHLGGLLLDLTAGFLLIIRRTRILGTVIVSSFHFMNSRMFTIGMFPYAMLASTMLFYNDDWPRKCYGWLRELLGVGREVNSPPQWSSHCLYEQQNPPEEASGTYAQPLKARTDTHNGVAYDRSTSSWRHRAGTLFVIAYISWQAFMPYSHFLTQGYNNWTNGLYGYSWDMMVHTWTLQHIKVTYHDKDTGRTGYLKPEAFAPDMRWASHADMAKQYAVCLQERLVRYDMHNVEIFFDVWMSLNSRFQQRMFDPDVDILTAEWHPLKPTPWQRPLLSELSDWRTRLAELKSKHTSEGILHGDAVFFADFTGGRLEHYIDKDLALTNLTVLKGEIVYTLEDGSVNITLKESETVMVPSDEFHFIITVSSEPSCYMYVFKNETLLTILQQGTASNGESQPSDSVSGTSAYAHTFTATYQSYWEQTKDFANTTRQLVVNSYLTAKLAVLSILNGVPLESLAEEYLP